MIRWWHQWKINRAMDDDPTGVSAERYVSGRPGCRRYKRSLDALESQLRDDADAWRTAGRASRRCLAPHRPKRSVLHVISWTSVAAVLVVGLMVALYGPGGNGVTSGNDRPNVSVDFAGMVTRSSSAIQQPLDTEAQRIAADTRAAARFALDSFPSFGQPARQIN
jgi:hypothetical protein